MRWILNPGRWILNPGRVRKHMAHNHDIIPVMVWIEFILRNSEFIISSHLTVFGGISYARHPVWILALFTNQQMQRKNYRNGSFSFVEDLWYMCCNVCKCVVTLCNYKTFSSILIFCIWIKQAIISLAQNVFMPAPLIFYVS